MRKRTMLKLTAVLIIMSMILTGLTACNQNASNPEQKDEKGSESVQPQEPEKTENKDPFGKYDETVTLTTGLRIVATDKWQIEDSFWHNKIKDELNVNIKVDWTADASQYDNKLNTVIASGDLPDFLFVGAEKLPPLVKGDMVTDISKYTDYLSPQFKKTVWSNSTYQEALNSVTYDGKITAIPTSVTELLNNSFPLFIRKDWLDNLGLDVPKTIEEFEKVALAFTNNDPDQNNKKDTYGLAITGQANLIKDWGGLYGFFPGYGVQPCIWYDKMLFYSKDSNGNVVWDGTKPEVKEGLQLLADLYKQGAIAKDFPTMDTTKVTEDLNGGKAGMVFGVRGLPIWAINKTILNNPEAEWFATNMPTKDGSPASIFVHQPVNVAYVISKKCANPEAVMKVINVTNKYKHHKSPDYDAITTEGRKSGYEYIYINDPAQERIQNEEFFKAVKNKDRDSLDVGMQDRYDRVMDYIENKTPENWPYWNGYYPAEGHAWYLTFAINNNDMLKQNAWWSMPTDTIVNKLPIFQKMCEETITKIITGNADVSEWDTMTETWNKLGGDAVKKEVQESLK